MSDKIKKPMSLKNIYFNLITISNGLNEFASKSIKKEVETCINFIGDLVYIGFNDGKDIQNVGEFLIKEIDTTSKVAMKKFIKEKYKMAIKEYKKANKVKKTKRKK